MLGPVQLQQNSATLGCGAAVAAGAGGSGYRGTADPTLLPMSPCQSRQAVLCQTRNRLETIYIFTKSPATSLLLVFARFDPRQIGPRLPAPAGATTAPARQARPDLRPAGVRNIPCLPPFGVQQSGRAVPHRGTACPTLLAMSPCQCRQQVSVKSGTVLKRFTFLRNRPPRPCCWCLLDLTRVKSGRACHQPRHGRGVLR